LLLLLDLDLNGVMGKVIGVVMVVGFLVMGLLLVLLLLVVDNF